jgi:CRISPR/Cas system-associated endonuclease Cas1
MRRTATKLYNNNNYSNKIEQGYNSNSRSSKDYSCKANEEAKERLCNAITMMERPLQRLSNAHTLREIFDVESDVGKLYHPNFTRLFKPELYFRTRNNQRNFRPYDASNIIDALLNYGFSLLYAEVAKQLNAPS